MRLTQRTMTTGIVLAFIAAMGYALHAYASSTASFGITTYNSNRPVTQLTLSNTGTNCLYWLHQYSPDVRPEWVSLNPIFSRTQQANLNYGGKQWLTSAGFIISLKHDVLPAFFREVESVHKDLFNSLNSIKCDLHGGMVVNFSRLLTPPEKEFLRNLADIHFHR